MCSLPDVCTPKLTSYLEDDLEDSLLELDVILDIRINQNMHDREIRPDNGWTIKIGRGLDFYQRPDGWFTVGANDLELRNALKPKSTSSRHK